MLESVPTGTVSLSLPATTIRAVSPDLPHTSCDPRWRKTSQPATFSAERISRYYLGIARNVRRGTDEPGKPGANPRAIQRRATP